MFGLSGTEILIICLVALLVLGPTKLPDLARTIGKGLREFRRATNGVRHSVEQEFYKMDQEISTTVPLDSAPHPPAIAPGAPAPAAPNVPASDPAAPQPGPALPPGGTK